MSTGPSADEPSFAGLMARAAAGDVAAQTALCEQYEPKVRIVARVLLGPALRTQFDSLDLVQSVHRSMLVGLRNRKFDISTPEKLIALASTIVRRKVARKWRTQKSRPRLVAGGGDSASLAGALGSACSPDAGPGQVAEFNDQVESLCRNLAPMERTILQMRLDGNTSAEVAAAIGMHPVALRVRWSRIRARLEEAGVLADWI